MKCLMHTVTINSMKAFKLTFIAHLLTFIALHLLEVCLAKK